MEKNQKGESFMSALRLRKKLGNKGQAMIEYALILVLIAVVVIGILTTLGTDVNNTFTTISNAFTGAGS